MMHLVKCYDGHRKMIYWVPGWLLVWLCLSTAQSQLHGQGHSLEQAVQKMTVKDGLQVTLFASEPEIRQPIFVKCDNRGRLWTIQYLQYPNPAGLERVQVDRWSRTVYDRIPKPPPYGPRGADRITILEDTNTDGKADRTKDFIDGLNLVTGLAFGHGGVFVLNVPYLLFYPDRDRDDVPDSDPEVLLTGFGMEDAQSMSNHLTWGPDGWLYGVNGSTTTCKIRGIEFQQGLWRYHPGSDQFELFCEGGSNCYGVTFDANGECYYSTNGGPFVHAMQGAYYYKSFGKHGPLHNLYAYHFFPKTVCDNVPGGPPTGGTIYTAEAFGKQVHGKFVAGNFLGHTASWWNIVPTGSTVRAKYGGQLLNSNDTWCGPTDMCLAPDGSMYLSDFHDQRTAHPDPDANWDLSNGRIYKIASTSVSSGQMVDFGSLSSDQLADLLSHPNRWFVDRARVELAGRGASEVAERLRSSALQHDDGQLALDSLWALHGVAALDDPLILDLLEHPHPYVRYWAIRLVGDQKQAAPPVARRFAELAAAEPSPVVRAQLACTAKRLPASTGLPIVEQLLTHFPQEADSRIPWLIWWAVESKVESNRDELLSMFASPARWENPAIRANGMRLIRRWAAEGTSASYEACARLLQSVPGTGINMAMEQVRQGLSERSTGLHGIGQGGLFGAHAAGQDGQPTAELLRFETLQGRLRRMIGKAWQAQPDNLLFLELALRANFQGANKLLIGLAFAEEVPVEQRVKLLGLVQEFSNRSLLPKVYRVLKSDAADAVKIAMLDVVAKYGQPQTTEILLEEYPHWSGELRTKARELIFQREKSATLFLDGIQQGTFQAEEVPLAELRQLSLFESESIDEVVRANWGNIGPGSTEEKLATMRRFNNDLRPGGGDPNRGKLLFEKQCGICHKLHGEGNKIGPDLTTANRKDRAALLANIVDPNAVIRREYLSYIVTTNSGQVVTGLLTEQDAASITVLDAKNARIKISRDEVEEIQESSVSLMPERILENLNPEEIRDLFSYLQN